MLVHCFWLLEFKFAFEFKCLIFSLNLSKFRSLFSPLEVSTRSRVAPSASWPSPASRDQPASVVPPPQPLTGGARLSSPTLRRPRAGLELESEPASTPRRVRDDLVRTPRFAHLFISATARPVASTQKKPSAFELPRRRRNPSRAAAVDPSLRRLSADEESSRSTT